MVAAIGIGAVAPSSFASDTDEQGPRPSILAPHATRSLLLDGVIAGERVVAVGERGHILVSEDDGKTWSQAPSPTRAMLTGVTFRDGQTGWAVGHDATILLTDDAGASWSIVHRAPEEERPLLDVWFRDADHGLAIGAYGFLLASDDGGRSWAARDIVFGDGREDAEEATIGDDLDAFGDFDDGFIDSHLNHIARSDDGRLYVAAEAGAIYRSDDDGETWTVLPSPYEGSFFGVLPLDGPSVLVFGLRGHLFRSDDAGQTWSLVETGTESMLIGGARLRDGRVIVVGNSGAVLTSRDGGRRFELEILEDRHALVSVLEAADGSVLLLGESGVTRIEPE